MINMECDHILGIEEDYETGRNIVNVSDKKEWALTLKFIFCPACGKNLLNKEAK